MNSLSRRRQGFTLIELMIVVVIVGILAAVALPAYQSYLKKGRRTDAKIALMNAAQAMERYYTENNKFTGATVGTVFPALSPDSHYTLSFDATPTASAYQINAAPTSTAQTGDKCGTFTIDNFGQKGVSGGSLTVSDCW